MLGTKSSLHSPHCSTKPPHWISINTHTCRLADPALFWMSTQLTLCSVCQQAWIWGNVGEFRASLLDSLFFPQTHSWNWAQGLNRIGPLPTLWWLWQLSLSSCSPPQSQLSILPHEDSPCLLAASRLKALRIPNHNSLSFLAEAPPSCLYLPWSAYRDKIESLSLPSAKTPSAGSEVHAVASSTILEAYPLEWTIKLTRPFGHDLNRL